MEELNGGSMFYLMTQQQVKHVNNYKLIKPPSVM